MAEYNINNSNNQNDNNNSDIAENTQKNSNLTDNVYEPITSEQSACERGNDQQSTQANTGTSQASQASTPSGMGVGSHGQYQNTPYSNPYFRGGNDGGAQASYTFSNDPSYGANAENQPKKKAKKKSGALKVAAVILSCIILAGATGIGGAYLAYSFLINDPDYSDTDSSNDKGADDSSADISDNEVNAPVNINKVEGSTTQNTTMTDVIAAVRDSVVEIVTENIQESQFYGQYVTSGAGSGVIISENGYIITNNHVVNGANTIYVRTTDEQQYQATVVGADEESDVAVIKIDATGLSAATLGDSDAIKLGEDVIAIGNPLGSLGGTVTNGIISALNREITIDGQKMVLLQTNAAVNPGNSGGGLFNMAGELIGVVNAKSSSSSSETTIEGLGFAIPINHAFDVASQLIEYGYVKGKVSLGITVYSYDKDMTYVQGFKYYTVKAGVYVDDPGKNTELEKDDRFVSIDGISVSTMSDIKSILAEHEVGDTIKATVARTENGREYHTEVTLTCYEYVPAS